jgi:O-acetyl-ADP-ribose deacetylase (regulator of RNase III)
MNELTIGSTAIRIVEADITTQQTDAVVNAANRYLHHGGGLAAAIVRAGGRVIQEESDHWIADHGPLSPGSAAVTGAGAMPARHVIHVAGPVYRQDQDNAGLLCAAVKAALDAAAAAGCRTVALPAISAGVFGYPLGEAASVITAACADWARRHTDLDEIRLVGFDAATAEAFQGALASIE